MFGVDIGDDGDGCGQVVEVVIGFVGFDYYLFVGVGVGIVVIGMDDVVIDDGWIQFVCIQKCCYYGCCCCFVMCFGNCYV